MSHLLVGLLGVLVGTLLGHRFTLHRERRKEYNEVIIPLKKAIRKKANDLNSSSIDPSLVSATQFKISDSLYHRIDNEFQKYGQLMREAMHTDEWGISHLKDDFVPQLIKILNKMDSLLKVK
ncbi:TPA: hypothetical protein NJ084_004642 [Vibrio parahaemolyticus]|nr:hypothetical protein [Vibrio parahaemolyticus]